MECTGIFSTAVDESNLPTIIHSKPVYIICWRRTMGWVRTRWAIERFLMRKRMKTSSRRRFYLWWNWNGLSTHCSEQMTKHWSELDYRVQIRNVFALDLLHASDCARSQRHFVFAIASMRTRVTVPDTQWESERASAREKRDRNASANRNLLYTNWDTVQWAYYH